MRSVDTSGLRALLAAYVSHPALGETRALALAEELEKVGVKLAELEQGIPAVTWRKVMPVLEEFLGVNKAVDMASSGTLRLIPAYDSTLKWVTPWGMRSMNLWGSHRDYRPEDPIARVVFDDGTVVAVLVRDLVASGISLPRSVCAREHG